MSLLNNLIWGAASILSGPSIALFLYGFAGPDLHPPDWVLWLFLVSGLILTAEGFMGMMLAVRNDVIEPRPTFRFAGLMLVSTGVFGWICELFLAHSSTLLWWPLPVACIGVLLFGLTFLPEGPPVGHGDL